MELNYQKVIAKLSMKLANEEANNAILEQSLEQSSNLINDQKLKHPEDFESEEHVNAKVSNKSELTKKE